jgi:hypothetical protein
MATRIDENVCLSLCGVIPCGSGLAPRHRGGRHHRDRPEPDRRAARARGRRRPSPDRARQLRARTAQPVRDDGRVLRWRHRRGDHRQAHRHVRLARPSQPERLGAARRIGDPGAQSRRREPPRQRRTDPAISRRRRRRELSRGRRRRKHRVDAQPDGTDPIRRERHGPRGSAGGGQARDRRREPHPHTPLPRNRTSTTAPSPSCGPPTTAREPRPSCSMPRG